MGTSEQGPGGYGVFSLQSLFTAAVLGLDPSKKCPNAGSPCVNTWCPWPHSGSQQDSSDAYPYNRCPGDRDSRPSPHGYLGSRSGYHGRSAPPHSPRSPHPCEGLGSSGQRGGQNPPPSHRFGPSHCRYTQPDSSAGGPHSTQRGATGSRPSPHLDLDSRSAPLGSWCAGHSPCLWGGTGKTGGQASSPVQLLSCSPCDTAPQPSKCSPGGSSAGGPSSRQPLG